MRGQRRFDTEVIASSIFVVWHTTYLESKRRNAGICMVSLKVMTYLLCTHSHDYLILSFIVLDIGLVENGPVNLKIPKSMDSMI